MPPSSGPSYLIAPFPSSAPEAGRPLDEGMRSGNLETERKQGECARRWPWPPRTERPVGVPRQRRRWAPAMGPAASE